MLGYLGHCENQDCLRAAVVKKRRHIFYIVVTGFIGSRSWHDKSLNHTGERSPPRSGGKPPGPSRLLRTSTISRGGGVSAPLKSSFKFVSRAAGSSLLGAPSGFSTFSWQPQMVRTMNHKQTTSCRLLLPADQEIAGKN